MSTWEYNYGLATQQTRLNDYAYQNKIDTLFFLQILLISLLILAIFAYGARVGLFSGALVLYVGVILFLLDLVIFMVRYAYDVNLRDPSVWSRRRFAYQGAVPDAPLNVNTSLPKVELSFPDLSGVDIGGLCSSKGYMKN
jgi:hypothetical protein